MDPEYSPDEGSPATRTRSASKNRVSAGSNVLASGMVLADVAGVLFAASETDEKINDHSPLRAADHFNMEDEPPGSGGDRF